MINEKLRMLHEQENEWNKQLAKLDLKIKGIQKEKFVLAKKVSKNMRYRNLLIDKLN